LLPDRKSTKPLIACDFEKDDDRNFHIDFIHSTANLKASAYEIKQVSRLQAKLIAGRIVPAIVTTTAAVSGLVIFELYKLLRKDIKLEHYRNSFFNLAINAFQITEPAPPTNYTWKGEKKSSWDSYKFREGDLTVKEFIAKLKEKYNFDPYMINYVLPDNSTKIVFQSFVNEENLEKKVSEVVSHFKKGGFSPNDHYFPLQIVHDVDEEDEGKDEDVFPPLWYYFK